MLIISSSAKTLDFTSDFDVKVSPQKPHFLKQSKEIHEYLQSKTVAELEKLLHVSEKIALLNFERMQEWNDTHTASTSRPSIYAYKGDVFRQLNPSEYTKAEQEYAARSLFVMSGLYGAANAYDLIQPYRLEMGAKLDTKIDGVMAEKLNDFWKPYITKYFNSLIKKEGHKALVDLASIEYSSAIDFEELDCDVIKVDFKEERDGELKIIGINAKRARGAMIEFMIKNQIKNPKDLTAFNENGYEFQGVENGNYLFVR